MIKWLSARKVLFALQPAIRDLVSLRFYCDKSSVLRSGTPQTCALHLWLEIRSLDCEVTVRRNSHAETRQCTSGVRGSNVSHLCSAERPIGDSAWASLNIKMDLFCIVSVSGIPW